MKTLCLTHYGTRVDKSITIIVLTNTRKWYWHTVIPWNTLSPKKRKPHRLRRPFIKVLLNQHKRGLWLNGHKRTLGEYADLNPTWTGIKQQAWKGVRRDSIFISGHSKVTSPQKPPFLDLLRSPVTLKTIEFAMLDKRSHRFFGLFCPPSPAFLLPLVSLFLNSP